MKVEYINPFLESVKTLFSTMLNVEVERGEITLTKTVAKPLGVTGIIGLSGAIQGIVALSFPVETALALVSRLLEEEIQEMDVNASDGVAELVNMIAGGAKGKLSSIVGSVIDLSLPTVVKGDNYHVRYPGKQVWLDIPFSSTLGTFSLRVTLKVDTP